MTTRQDPAPCNYQKTMEERTIELLLTIATDLQKKGDYKMAIRLTGAVREVRRNFDRI